MPAAAGAATICFLNRCVFQPLRVSSTPACFLNPCAFPQPLHQMQMRWRRARPDMNFAG